MFPRMNHPLTTVQSDEISVLYEIASKLNLASSAVEWLEAVSTYARQAEAPDTANNTIGFRCAATP